MPVRLLCPFHTHAHRESLRVEEKDEKEKNKGGRQGEASNARTHAKKTDMKPSAYKASM